MAKRHIEEMREVEDKMVDFVAKFLIHIRNDVKYEYYDLLIEKLDSWDYESEDIPKDVLHHYVKQDWFVIGDNSIMGLIKHKIAGDMKLTKHDIAVLAEQIDIETNGFFFDNYEDFFCYDFPFDRDFVSNKLPKYLETDTEEKKLNYVVRSYLCNYGHYKDWSWNTGLNLLDEEDCSSYNGKDFLKRVIERERELEEEMERNK